MTPTLQAPATTPEQLLLEYLACRYDAVFAAMLDEAAKNCAMKDATEVAGRLAPYARAMAVRL
jgi:hypothetical protein